MEAVNQSSVIKVEGRTFPIEIYHALEAQQDYLSGAVKATIQILLFEEHGDVLVFLTGQEEIEELEQILKDKLRQIHASLLESSDNHDKDQVVKIDQNTDGQSDPFVICPLYANLPQHEQMRAFQRFPGQRKVVLSTNIAETSVTIPGIKYVVDSGLSKIRTFKNSTGVDALKITPISKNSATQRAGRAGREQAGGKCFRIYTEESHTDLDDNTIPEILRCNLSGIILNLKAMGIDDVSKMDFIDKPD